MVGLISLDRGEGETEELWSCTVRIQPGSSPKESYCQEPKLPTLCPWTLSLLRSSKLLGFVMVALVTQDILAVFIY